MLQKGEKIGEEEIKCKAMADLALADLNEAIPALEAAMKVEYACVCQLRGGGHVPFYPSAPSIFKSIWQFNVLHHTFVMASYTIY